MIREEILNAKLITIVYSAVLPMSLICLTAHHTDFNDDDCHYDCDLLMMIILKGLLLSLLSVLSPLLGL